MPIANTATRHSPRILMRFIYPLLLFPLGLDRPTPMSPLLQDSDAPKPVIAASPVKPTVLYARPSQKTLTASRSSPNDVNAPRRTLSQWEYERFRRSGRSSPLATLDIMSHRRYHSAQPLVNPDGYRVSPVFSWSHSQGIGWLASLPQVRWARPSSVLGASYHEGPVGLGHDLPARRSLPAEQTVDHRGGT